MSSVIGIEYRADYIICGAQCRMETWEPGLERSSRESPALRWHLKRSVGSEISLEEGVAGDKKLTESPAMPATGVWA